MDKVFLRRYLPAILLMLGVVLIWSARGQSEVPLVGSLSSVLPVVPGYRVEQQTVTPEEARVAGMTNYVARAFYKDTMVAFTTYVGYYDRQTQGKSMHSPRNCLPGAGWEVLSAGTATVTAAGTAHEVNKYLLKNGPYQAVALYWYQGRGRIVADEYAVKWNLLRDAALKGHTEEALVRVVVYVTNANLSKDKLDRAYADAERLGEQISAQVLVDVSRVLPKDGGVAVAMR